MSASMFLRNNSNNSFRNSLIFSGTKKRNHCSSFTREPSSSRRKFTFTSMAFFVKWTNKFQIREAISRQHRLTLQRTSENLLGHTRIDPTSVSSYRVCLRMSHSRGIAFSEVSTTPILKAYHIWISISTIFYFNCWNMSSTSWKQRSKESNWSLFYFPHWPAPIWGSSSFRCIR